MLTSLRHMYVLGSINRILVLCIVVVYSFVIQNGKKSNLCAFVYVCRAQNLSKAYHSESCNTNISLKLMWASNP